eukprot:1626258-Rhodomonas_salina.1
MHARRSAATAVELWWGHSLGTDCGRVECAKTVLNQPLKQHSGGIPNIVLRIPPCEALTSVARVPSLNNKCTVCTRAASFGQPGAGRHVSLHARGASISELSCGGSRQPAGRSTALLAAQREGGG